MQTAPKAFQRFFCLTALCLTAAAAVSWAQAAQVAETPETGLVIRSDTRLVVLHTTVQDGDNHPVADLPQSAFEVYEDGQLQTLKLFRREDVPVSLGILVDNSGSMRDKRLKVNAAALDFVRASNPEDEAFIVNFNDEAFLDTDFTAEVERLQDALQRIDARGGTALYDAIGMSLDHLTEKGKWDKKVILLISDGEDNASRTTLEKIVRQLQETDTVVFAVGLLSEEDRRSARRAQRALRNMVEATGGAAFFPGSVDEVHGITQQVAHDIRNQYILGYTPDESKPPGYRQVRVELTGKARKYKVRHRPGYYGQ
jgi:Ca-activated chloride channel homolog